MFRKLLVLLGLLCSIAHASATFTNLTSGGSTTTFVTAAVTPTANKPVLVAVFARLATGNGPGPATSITGAGLTMALWDAQAVVDSGSTVGTGKAGRLEVWCGTASSPTTQALTIVYGTTPAGVSWSVDQTAGAAATCAAMKGNFYPAFVTTATATPLTVATTAFQVASSSLYVVGEINDHSGQAVGQGAGFTELGPATTQVPSSETEYATSLINPAQITYGGPTSNWGILAMEVKVPASTALIPRKRAF